MAVRMRFEDIRRPQRFDAVDHHALAFAIENPERQILVETPARDDLIDGILRKIVGPRLKVVVVDIVCAIDNQILIALIGSFVIPLIEPHTAPIARPESTDRNFGRPRRLRGLHIAPTHLQERVYVTAAFGSALHEFIDTTVFKRHQVGGAREVALAQPALSHFLVVILVAKVNPKEFCLFRPRG